MKYTVDNVAGAPSKKGRAMSAASQATSPHGHLTTMTHFGIYLGDLDRSHNSSHGIINFALAVTQNLLPHLTPGEHLTVVANEEILEELGINGELNVVRVPRPNSRRQRLHLDHVVSIEMATTYRFDVAYFPKGLTPWRWPKTLAVAATVHDSIPLRYLTGRYGLRNVRPGHAYTAASLVSTLCRADAVSTVSEFCREEFNSARWSRQSVQVIPNAISSAPSARVGAKERDIVYFGSRHAHKKDAQTQRWLADLMTSDRGLRVGAIGGPTPRNPAVEHLVGLSNTEVAGVIAGTRVVVFNSDYEGFGLPPVEAFAVGTAAVFPAIRPMTDTLDGVPGAFEPDDDASFRAAVMRAMAMDPDELARHGNLIKNRWGALRQGRAAASFLRTAGRPARVGEDSRTLPLQRSRTKGAP